MREQIEKAQHPEHTLLDLKLMGLLHAEEQDELAHIKDILNSRFLFGQLDASDLRPSPDDDSWITAIPPGIVREAAARLRNMAASEEDEAFQNVAARALVELYAIAGEIRR